ncbi:UDP-N-acetylenolpyruvoylglucosamine reductase [Synechococcus sp. 63AY4M2]|uniref:UDP-N-acetylenolpyruvoylglucosamine reductase n=1 Tax=Synechococcus sp. (strain JA-3-3Ab) TaxID=321327 RepID=MURB_SYNJA|nr:MULTISPECIES: UDP-N-acetylmuramate dehydrogenase [unclassified Synechococcus]Q2JTH4.1 RecName: Full=UDP-N-acetylenolpyruvoylglucosamine reductase; AltName: Full=UDP-N-acetylmuramate dehydrogenase [Synechococcus sp. JA-3-3Ab]ABD00023.1 UDP-N-acetylenolpyruvoylglucosamine reductase [Synechococcus sp. JA-3-3Ab]PIK87069.1 UDP-N-acetylenolpyruvoylglucosamine reductase [Synechococcus sp. 63AY4M2]
MTTAPCVPNASSVARLSGRIQAGIPLAPLTTFRVGGKAEWYCEPHNNLELQQCLAWARAQGIPVTLLGAGSNLLISDAGLPGLVIHTRRLRGMQLLEGGRIWAAAGEPLVNLARAAAKRGWSGLEWAIGIPGTLGGAVVMNAGAHGRAMSDVLVEVQILDEEQEPCRLEPVDLQFGYRRSRLQDSPWTVTGATLQLLPGRDPAQVQRQTQRHLNQRLSSQPYHLPSCGSVFRNPETHPAGWLIEQVGLKGYRIGGAQISERHANFILNCGQASANDIYRLICLAQEKVYQRWSIFLEPEVRILGSFDDPLIS